MSTERLDFSQRLADAMLSKGYEPKPGVLLRLFNSRYEGRSIAFSSASKWLRGLALPEQDKLQVLAKLFGVEPHELRYGKSTKRPSSEPAVSSLASPSDTRENQAINAFLALSPKRRDLVIELIAELGKPAGQE